MRTKRVAICFGLVSTLAVVSVPAQSTSPSFDCSKASGEIEGMICRDAELAALDRKMAEVYTKALENWPANIGSEQKAMQRGWIKGRNECWKADDKRACVVQEYRSRTVELQIQSGALEAPTPVGYACEGRDTDAKPLTVSFYRETDPPSAVVTYGEDQVIAFLSPSASGAKYSASNVVLWEHHGEATLDWFGTELHCKAR